MCDSGVLYKGKVLKNQGYKHDTGGRHGGGCVGSEDKQKLSFGFLVSAPSYQDDLFSLLREPLHKDDGLSLS
jgi:hypothetical protein